MNTSFKPSEFDKQAAASLDMLDEQAAAKRVQQILHPEPQGARSQAQAGPTLTPAPQTQPQAPAKPNRKPRSDKGVPKGSKISQSGLAQADEVTVRLPLEDARQIPMNLPAHLFWISASIQDQIIAQLQKRLDALQKGK